MSDDGNLSLMQDLTEHECVLFLTELNGKQKNGTVAVLLALLLGGVGGHRFYMGQTGLGILYICFSWTLVPACVALAECFFMSRRVRVHNRAMASNIALRLTGLRVDADASK